jgi:hypothetical protein
MTTDAEPADTRMMGIVHGALRRDLLRTRDALTAEPFRRADSGERSASMWYG